MANSASIRTGLAGLMQDHLSNKVVSLLFNTMPLVYFLLAKDGQKKNNLAGGTTNGFYGLGRPATGSLFSGIPISKPRQETILNSDKYMPLVQVSAPAETDGKVMGMYSTVPTMSNWDTAGVTTQFTRPFFKWCEIADPILVANKDIQRTESAAPNEKSANAAIGDLFKVQTEGVLSTHLQRWNQLLWGTYAGSAASTSGAPSNVDAETWDGIYSLKSAFKADNVYGGVDRSISANSWWRGNYDTTSRPAVLQDIINDAAYTKGIAKKGQGAELVICSMTSFPIFAAEAVAKGGQVVYNGLPNMGEFGFTRPIIRFNNTYCIYDPECPATELAVLNLGTFTVAISPKKNFAISKPFDLSQTEGGKDARQSMLRTELMIACEAPSLNVYYTNIANS